MNLSSTSVVCVASTSCVLLWIVWRTNQFYSSRVESQTRHNSCTQKTLVDKDLPNACKPKGSTNCGPANEKPKCEEVKESLVRTPSHQGLKGNEARQAQYDDLQRDFAESGLDIQAVKDAQLSFGGLEENDWPGIWPKPYPMPYPSVRLLVFPLDGGQFAKDASLARAFTLLTQQVVRALMMAGVQVYSNPRASYHTSMFYYSHPSDPRPDSLTPGGGAVFRGGQLVPPSSEVLETELNHTQAALAQTPHITLQVDRVVLTRGGTMLVLFNDVSKPVDKDGSTPADALRSLLRLTFPGAPLRQPEPLLHCTLLRILAPAADLPKHTAQQVADICAKWTTKLKGMEYTVDTAWLAHEKCFSSLEGDKHVLPLKTPDSSWKLPFSS